MRKELAEARKKLFDQAKNEPVHFFVTTCSENKRGQVWQTSSDNFEQGWLKIEKYLDAFSIFPKWVKIERLNTVKKVSAKEGQQAIFQTQRNNYFPYGVSFNEDPCSTFLPEEITGNALLVPHPEHRIARRDARLMSSEENIQKYSHYRDQKDEGNSPVHFGEEWTFFTKKGVFIEDGKTYSMETEGYGQGVRKIGADNQWTILEQGIRHGAQYLVDQITGTGKFIYGYFPVRGRKINSYNSVRHYSSLYALLEAYDYLREQELVRADFLEKIEQGLQWGLMHLTKVTEDAYYVVDGEEVKLGAQAMVILALTKYQTVTGNQQFLPSIEKFLHGMKSFIAEDGSTTHVLNEELTESEAFRIIYYDGEALFAIMRAYPLVGKKEWLDLAELLMNHFIQKRYERYHDHWLSYSVNELTTYLPKRKYFEFGIRNALENLAFIEKRDTAYPTMLELVVAAVKMFDRIQEIDFEEPLFTLEEFTWLKSVMEKRAIHELRTGTMWPELAMFFAQPETIVGGFYVRHDRCRMRIDDAEHFLSGLINYQVYSSPEEVTEAVINEADEDSEVIENSEEESLAISVVIPVYNREKELANCLTQLAQSTLDHSQFEVIVVDDASTDQTVKVVEEFQEHFDHLRVLRLAENSGGASVPRNLGLKQSKGKWVVFVDSDDYLTPHALEDAYQLAIEEEETDLVCMPYFRAEGSRRALGRSCFQSPTAIKGVDFLDTKLYNSLNIVGKLMRKEVVDRYQLEFPTKIRVREDNWFSMKLYAVVRKIAFLGNMKDYYFCGEWDTVSLSKIGTPPRDAMKIYAEVFRFVFSLEEVPQKRKEDILAIYLNRYATMIKRGRYAPTRLFDQTGHSLYFLKRSTYLDTEAKQFINDLYSGKYDVQ
ncbi:glycosyltransferase family 2 protein [Enterococcus sp. AZ163]|uniref:glycosyltransferase family 2 protein n=1 Tax=Enterococcus sp. AZ163 TaxID=2774638 RepID=UPI003D2870A7